MNCSWSYAREKYLKDIAIKIYESSFDHRKDANFYTQIHKLATFTTIIITFISICVIYVLPDEQSKDIYNVSSHGVNIIILAYLSAFNPQAKGSKFERTAAEFAKTHNKIMEQLNLCRDNRKNYDRFLGEVRGRIDLEIDRTGGTNEERLVLFSLSPPDETMGSSTHIIHCSEDNEVSSQISCDILPSNEPIDN